jgi:aminoglycoside phosphotransferase (APT) family kinase protein
VPGAWRTSAARRSARNALDLSSEVRDGDGMSLDPASLSPVPVPPRPCALPYGLTWSDVAHVLPGLNARAADSPRAFVSHQKQGLHKGWTSVILTVRYPTRDGHAARGLFVKYAGPEDREAARYRLLAERGVPTPEVLAVVSGPDGSEVIVLELLASTGIDVHSPTQVAQLLDLVAAWNAIPGTPDLEQSTLTLKPGYPHDVFATMVQRALEQLRGLDQAAGCDVDPVRWFDGYRAAKEVEQTMPTSLTHGELHVHHTGWSTRGGVRRLVPLDLQTMGIRARFTDIASISDLAHHTGRRDLDLFAEYLSALGKHAGTEPDLARGYDEMRWLRIVQHVECLPWRMNALDDPVLGTEGVALLAHTLRDDLVAVGAMS